MCSNPSVGGGRRKEPIMTITDTTTAQPVVDEQRVGEIAQRVAFLSLIHI